MCAHNLSSSTAGAQRGACEHVQIHGHVPRNFVFGRQKAENVLIFLTARTAEGLQKVSAITREACQSIRDRAINVEVGGTSMADVVPGAAGAVITGLVECASGSDKLLV